MKRFFSIALCITIVMTLMSCDKDTNATKESEISTKSEVSEVSDTSDSYIESETSETSEQSVATSDETTVETSIETTVETTVETTIETSEETTIPSKPYLSEINHYVTSKYEEYYMSDEEKVYFRKAMDALLNHESKVDLLESYDSNLRIFGAIKNSPYYFLVDDVKFYKNHQGFKYKYKYDETEHKNKIEFIDSKMLEIINQIITPDMNELDKALSVNKYFAENIAYDYEWLNEFELSTDKFLFPDATIYEALEDGYGVCHTYTYLDCFVFDQVGMTSMSKSSDMFNSDTGHMWTAVKIGDNFYHVDTCWAREEGLDDNDEYFVAASLKYFGMTSEERINSGVDYREIPSDNYYSNVEMTDDRFVSFRNVYKYELLGNHKVKLYKNGPDGNYEEIIDTEDFM